MDHQLIVRLIYDLLVVLAAGLVAAAICRRVGVSMLVGYLVIGALIGAGGLGLVREDPHGLQYVAETGVLLLLFSIGIEFSLGELLRMGRSLVVGGSAQMMMVAAPVMLTAMVAGQSWRSALLFGAATAFSSTILVFKALEEWGQTASPHGRRGIAILLFQDAALVPLILFVPLLTGQARDFSGAALAMLTIKAAAFLAAIPVGRALVARWLAPLLARLRSVELVVLFTVVVLGSVTLGAYALGLPLMIGAFAAGLALNGNRLTRQIDAVILPFRETFAAVFFVGLGTLIRFDALLIAPVAAVGALLAVLMLKVGAAAVALRLTGLRWMAALGMGLGLAQIGEFAFVLLLVGLLRQVISPFGYDLMMLVAVATLIVTPQLLKVGLRLAERAPWLEHEIAIRPAAVRDDIRRAAVVGIGHVGWQVASQLEIKGYDTCLIDLSPINLHPFAQQGFRTIVGDASDPDVLQRADLSHCTLAVVAVPDDQAAARIVSAIRRLNSACTIAVRCRFQANTARLHKLGADQVLSEEVEVAGTLVALLDRLV